MKKRLISLLAVLVVLLTSVCSPLSAAAAYPLAKDRSITAKSAVVVYLGSDMSNDMLMYEKDADTPLAPAGLVRILVGMYALKCMEEQQIDSEVATATFSQAISDQVDEVDMITLGIKVGAVWHLEDLLNVAMLQTAADAVTMLVASLAGTQEAFVEGMNKLATDIGCTNSHFTNVYGLDDPNQYTTARDMYRILRYAGLHYPRLVTILGQSECTVKPVVGEEDYWPTTNEMLRESSEYYYAPLVYGRSGYTESIGQSCASVARDEGYEYLTVVMGSDDTPPPKADSDQGDGDSGGEDEEEETGSDGPAFLDTMELFRWVYNTFSYQTVVSQNQPISRIGVDLAWSTDSVALVAGSDFKGMLRNEVDLNALRYEMTYAQETLTAPIEQGQICGTARVYDGEYYIGEITLCAAQSIGRSQLLAVGDAIWTVLTSPVMLTIFALLFALFVGYIVITLLYNRSRRKKKHKRVKRYR